MENVPVIMVIGLEGPPSAEEEWNKWYSEKHVPDAMKYKGMKKASRYKIIDDTEQGKYPTYLAIYEFESREAAEAFEQSPEHFAALGESNRLWVPKGHKRKWRVHYQLIKTLQK